MTTAIAESLVRETPLPPHLNTDPLLTLHDHAISEVHIAEPALRYHADYSERPLRYKVRLAGEARLRRVYATPIGNVSVVYLKSKGRNVYCETALEIALESRVMG